MQRHKNSETNAFTKYMIPTDNIICFTIAQLNEKPSATNKTNTEYMPAPALYQVGPLGIRKYYENVIYTQLCIRANGVVF